MVVSCSISGVNDLFVLILGFLYMFHEINFMTVMQAAFLFTVVGTTGFLGVLAGQLPGVSSILFLTFLVFLQYIETEQF